MFSPHVVWSCTLPDLNPLLFLFSLLCSLSPLLTNCSSSSKLYPKISLFFLLFYILRQSHMHYSFYYYLFIDDFSDLWPRISTYLLSCTGILPRHLKFIIFKTILLYFLFIPQTWPGPLLPLLASVNHHHPWIFSSCPLTPTTSDSDELITKVCCLAPRYILSVCFFSLLSQFRLFWSRFGTFWSCPLICTNLVFFLQSFFHTTAKVTFSNCRSYQAIPFLNTCF